MDIDCGLRLTQNIRLKNRPVCYFHSSKNNQVKTLPHLLDIYYNSIGRNTFLLINFPVDTLGLIHEKDTKQILKLAEAIKSDFAVNLVEGIKITTFPSDILFIKIQKTDKNETLIINGIYSCTCKSTFLLTKQNLERN